MKAIWQGTDSLLLIRMPKQLMLLDKYYVLKLRLFARIVDKFVTQHYCCGELTRKNLKEFGMKKPLIDYRTPIDQSLKVSKIPHDTFNILYYFPKRTKFREWLYGWDIFSKVRSHFETNDGIRFIIVSGKDDMKNVYPYIDLMIRPNRHDGFPRMVGECELNDIPYYWSNENPKILEIVNLINKMTE